MSIIVFSVILETKHLNKGGKRILRNCLNDGKIASRGRIILIPRKDAPVVAVNVASNGPRNLMKWQRGKPARAPIVSKVSLNTTRGQPHKVIDL